MNELNEIEIAMLERIDRAGKLEISSMMDAAIALSLRQQGLVRIQYEPAILRHTCMCTISGFERLRVIR